MSDTSSKINPEKANKKIFFYENYFKGTKSLKDNFSDKELEIKSNIRIFQSQEKNSGYDEIFLNEDSEIFGGISNHISLLYPSKIRGYENRIGFRYYKEQPLLSKKNIPYFTLVRTGITTFKILEKESEIKDNKGESFMIDDLDCLDIILTIIKEKIKKDEDHLTYPNSMSELLGFIYSCKYLKNKINNLEILDPFIPSPFEKETLFEAKTKKKTSVFYLEPILWNKHISLLLFYYEENLKGFITRNNILFDMSSFHYKRILKKDPIFDKDMVYNITKFPNNSIQMGNSCSMWFYASFLFLLRNKIEIPFKKEVLYMIIEYLYILLNYKDKDINKAKYINRENENIDRRRFISYKLALKSFVDIDPILEELNWNKNIGPGGLGEYQKQYLELKNDMDLLKINFKYYEKVFNMQIISKDESDNIISLLASLEDYFYSIIKARKKAFACITSKEKKENLYELNSNINNSILSYSSLAKEIKEVFSLIKDKYQFYSRSRIHEFYFQNNDIFLNIMDN